MLSTVKKDKNCRTLVKKFEIKKLYAKVFQQDLSLKNILGKKSIVFLSSDKEQKFSAYRVNEASDSTAKMHDFSLESFLYEKATKGIPRNSSKTRVKNRCIKSGRSRAVFKFCKLSRIGLREEASKGAIPGVYKASW